MAADKNWSRQLFDQLTQSLNGMVRFFSFGSDKRIMSLLTTPSIILAYLPFCFQDFKEFLFVYLEP
jgi:hypothetical protein